MTTFISFNGKSEMHLVSLMLRSGDSGATVGAIPLLSRLIPKIKKKFPKATIRVRADGAFSCPDFLEFLESISKVQYVINLPKNSVLEAKATKLMRQTRRDAKEARESQRSFGECRYEARTWEDERRVIIKAEVTYLEDRDPRDNPRFVVTNMRNVPQRLYMIYCERGESENRIKELKRDLSMDRTSCTKMMANQFRVILTGAAYVLLQELRCLAKGTRLEKSQAGTLRLRLLKIGARLKESSRRIVLHCPEGFAALADFQALTRKLRPSLT